MSKIPNESPIFKDNLTNFNIKVYNGYNIYYFKGYMFKF